MYPTMYPTNSSYPTFLSFSEALAMSTSPEQVVRLLKLTIKYDCKGFPWVRIHKRHRKAFSNWLNSKNYLPICDYVELAGEYLPISWQIIRIRSSSHD
jgi:hypothetical protein